MSKSKVWTLPELLDRIWTLSRGKRTAVETTDKERLPIGREAARCIKRVVTGWDEDYKPRTYELNKISAASAAALYERIKTMRSDRSVPQALSMVVARLASQHRDRETSDEFWATVRDWTGLGDFDSIRLCQKARVDPYSGESE